MSVFSHMRQKALKEANQEAPTQELPIDPDTGEKLPTQELSDDLDAGEEVPANVEDPEALPEVDDVPNNPEETPAEPEDLDTTDLEQDDGMENLTPVVYARPFNFSAHHVDHANLNMSLSGLHKSISQLALITGFSKVVKEHSLSAPVAATMRAVPGFQSAVQKFPETDLYSVVPESRSSTRLAIGLESLEEAETSSKGDLSEKLTGVSSAFETVLSGVCERAGDLCQQIASVKARLEKSDLSDEVVAKIKVTTLSSEALEKTLGMIEKHLSCIEECDCDDLRANPENVKAEIDCLTDLVDDLGRILGLSIDDEGLVAGPKGDDYTPSDGTFESQDITKDALIFYLDKADAIVDLLKGLGEKKDVLTKSVHDEASEVPSDAEGDDTTYGAIDHATLVSSYVTLVTKLIDESIILVSRILAAADTIVTTDAAPEAEPEASAE